MSYDGLVGSQVVEFCNGLQMTKKDIMYWRSLLQVNRRNPEAMYYVALDTEKDAMIALENYKNNNNNNMYLEIFKTRIVKAINLLKSAVELGYKPAQPELLRIKKEIESVDLTNLSKKKTKCKNKKSMSKQHAIILFVLAFVLGNLLSMGFFVLKGNTNSIKFVENINMIPYKVSYYNPEEISFNQDYKRKLIQIDEGNVSKEEVERQIVATLKTLYSVDSNSPKVVFASFVKNGVMKEIGTGVIEDDNMDIYIYLD